MKKKESLKKEKELSVKKERILFIISVIIIVIIIYGFGFILTSSNPSVVINRGGITSDYSKYREYAELIRFYDNYNENVATVLGKIALVLGVLLIAFAIYRVIKKKGTIEAKILYVIRWIIISLIIFFITVGFNEIVLYANGVRVNKCWCGPGYVEINGTVTSYGWTSSNK